MRSTERKLKKLANALPKSKSLLTFPDVEEEKRTSPLFFKLTVPVMAVLILFGLTLAVSAEVREAVFGLFLPLPVSSEQVSSDKPVSSDYESLGPKPFYTHNELSPVLPTGTKDGVDEFAELYAVKYADELSEEFDIELFKKGVTNITPENVRERTDVQIFMWGTWDFFGYHHCVMYGNELYKFKYGFFQSALICDYNGDGHEEIVISIYHQTSGVYPFTDVHILNTATKEFEMPIKIWDAASIRCAILTYASEDDLAEGIFFYVLIPDPYDRNEYPSVSEQLILPKYTTIGDIRLNDEGKLCYREYGEEELAKINSQG